MTECKPVYVPVYAEIERLLAKNERLREAVKNLLTLIDNAMLSGDVPRPLA